MKKLLPLFLVLAACAQVPTVESARTKMNAEVRSLQPQIDAADRKLVELLRIDLTAEKFADDAELLRWAKSAREILVASKPMRDKRAAAMKDYLTVAYCSLAPQPCKPTDEQLSLLGKSLLGNPAK